MQTLIPSAPPEGLDRATLSRLVQAAMADLLLAEQQISRTRYRQLMLDLVPPEAGHGH